MGCSQTGTGKTAAFALPILQRLFSPGRRPASGAVRALVLTPTRELAIQVSDNFISYGRYLNLKTALVVGGMSQKHQVEACSKGVDVLVATPGRLLDLLSQRCLSLDKLEIFVLDEADRMLDMGFLPDIKRLLAIIPKQRQSLFFSATMSPTIIKLATSILANPVRIQITPVTTPVPRIDQRVFFVSQASKRALLDELLKDPRIERALIFTRTKHGANRVVKQLVQNPG